MLLLHDFLNINNTILKTQTKYMVVKTVDFQSEYNKTNGTTFVETCWFKIEIIGIVMVDNYLHIVIDFSIPSNTRVDFFFD